MKKLEEFLEWGGVKKDVTFLILSGIALLASLLNIELFHVDLAWVAIIFVWYSYHSGSDHWTCHKI